MHAPDIHSAARDFISRFFKTVRYHRCPDRLFHLKSADYEVIWVIYRLLVDHEDVGFVAASCGLAGRKIRLVHLFSSIGYGP